MNWRCRRRPSRRVRAFQCCPPPLGHGARLHGWPNIPGMNSPSQPWWLPPILRGRVLSLPRPREGRSLPGCRSNNVDTLRLYLPDLPPSTQHPSIFALLGRDTFLEDAWRYMRCSSRPNRLSARPSSRTRYCCIQHYLNMSLPVRYSHTQPREPFVSGLAHALSHKVNPAHLDVFFVALAPVLGDVDAIIRKTLLENEKPKFESRSCPTGAAAIKLIVFCWT